ncbi:MAG: hypothetical protein ABSD59_20775 [Terracidiphilus sp.]
MRLISAGGSRWEVVGAFYETNSEWSGVDLPVSNTSANRIPGALVFVGQLKKKTFGNSDFAVILPRAGFAYNPNPRTVFRAGFDVNSEANLQSVSVNNPQGSRPMTFTNYTTASRWTWAAESSHKSTTWAMSRAAFVSLR